MGWDEMLWSVIERRYVEGMRPSDAGIENAYDEDIYHRRHELGRGKEEVLV